MKTLGDLITNFMKEHDLSQRDFAKLADISHTYVSKLQTGIDPRNGKAIMPTLDTVEKVSKAMGKTVEEVLREIGYISNNEQTFVEPSLTDKEKELIEEYDGMPDFEDPGEAMKFIIEQPALAAYGGYDLNQMEEDEIMDLVNQLLVTLRISIEKRKKK